MIKMANTDLDEFMTIMNEVNRPREGYCCQRIPYFRYRIIAIIFGLCVMAGIIVLSPFIGAIHIIEFRNVTCSLNENPTENYYCYFSGFINLGLLSLLIFVVVSYINHYMNSIRGIGWRAYCCYIIIIPTRHRQINISTWTVYLIIISIVIIYLFVLPYNLAVPIFGIYTQYTYMVTMIIFGGGTMILIAIIYVLIICIDFCNGVNNSDDVTSQYETL